MTVEMVVQTLIHNAEVAKTAVVNAIGLLRGAPSSPYANALEYAMITNRQRVEPAVIERVRPLIGHYF